MNPTPSVHPISTTLVEITALANALCDDLTDEQFARAARIRALAESALPENGNR